MGQPLISVIVPVYKVEEYLPRCIDSILAQTYKNLEIILVDDGSPDKCPAICDEYAKKDSRIKVIHKKNGGLSDARNAGLDLCSGEKICFIDSDDYVSPRYVEDLYGQMMKTNSDLVLCGFVKVFQDGTFGEPERLEGGIIAEEEYWNAMYGDAPVNYIVAWNKLYDRRLFEKVRYAKGRINEDEIILHQIISKCHIVSAIRECDYFYLVRDDSIMGKRLRKYITSDSFYGHLGRLKYFIESKRWKLAEKQAMFLMSQLSDNELNKEYARQYARVAQVIPKKYVDDRFRLKVQLLKYVPSVFLLKDKRDYIIKKYGKKA